MSRFPKRGLLSSALALSLALASPALAQPTGVAWTDIGSHSVGIAGLDGSDPTVIVPGLDVPLGIDVDPNTGKLYWAAGGVLTHDPKIQRSNPDGTELEDVVIDLNRPRDVAVDPLGGKIYWTCGGLFSDLPDFEDPTGATERGVLFPDWHIMRANLDGSDVETIHTFGFFEVFLRSIDVDPIDGQIYFSDHLHDQILQSNLDGSDLKPTITDISNPRSVSVDLQNRKLYIAAGGLFLNGLDNPYPAQLGETQASLGWTISRVDLDGTDYEELLSFGFLQANLGGLVVDPAGGKMYWVDVLRHGIRRANLDGTEVEDIVGDLVLPYDVALAQRGGLGITVTDVPAASEWTLIILGLLLISGGTVVLRRNAVPATVRA